MTVIMKNKHLRKLVLEAFKASFDGGGLSDVKIAKHIKLFKSLSTSQAIFALTEYGKLLKRETAKHTLIVESVMDLNKAELEKIKESFSGRYTINDTRFTKVSSLLGGIRVKIADTVFDDSVQAKIGQVKEAIRS